MTIGQGASSGTEVANECDPGFVGPVALTLEAPPVGASGAFAPDALRCGDASTLTLDVAATTEPGSYAVHVQGESAAFVWLLDTWNLLGFRYGRGTRLTRRGRRRSHAWRAAAGAA